MVQHVMRVDVACRDLDRHMTQRVADVHQRNCLPVIGIDLPRDVFHLNLGFPVGRDFDLGRLQRYHLMKNKETFHRGTQDKFISLSSSHVHYKVRLLHENTTTFFKVS